MDGRTYLFMDTEFTNLENPELISIGMVSEYGEEFYAELTDGWSLGECSLFTAGRVLPLLDGGRFGKILEEPFGGRLPLLRLALDQRGIREALKEDALAETVRNCTVAEWQWLEDLEARGAESGGVDTLRLKDVPELFEAAARIDPGTAFSGESARSRRETAAALAEWIVSIPGEAVLIADDYFDRNLSRELLAESGADLPNLSELPLTFPGRSMQPPLRAEIEKILADYHRWAGRRHHALEDARGLHEAWQRFFQSGNSNDGGRR